MTPLAQSYLFKDEREEGDVVCVQSLQLRLGLVFWQLQLLLLFVELYFLPLDILNQTFKIRLNLFQYDPAEHLAVQLLKPGHIVHTILQDLFLLS